MYALIFCNIYKYALNFNIFCFTETTAKLFTSNCILLFLYPDKYALNSDTNIKITPNFFYTLY